MDGVEAPKSYQRAGQHSSSPPSSSVAVNCYRILRFLHNLQESVQLRFRRDPAIFEEDIVVFHRTTDELLRVIRLSVTRTILVVSAIEADDSVHFLLFENFHDGIPDSWTPSHVPGFLRVLKGPQPPRYDPVYGIIAAIVRINVHVEVSLSKPLMDYHTMIQSLPAVE
jgi:hypothetical protein